ncbi:hypothetical protein [Actinoplanes rectilineatus]|uniref:hypothetical protein n=1 Tax=Actinoplanes rectilineatus TaxID=113571 RepID=UPI0005F2AC1C|nr:hypothetical protein [Actinoplanes rectilineatus]
MRKSLARPGRRLVIGAVAAVTAAAALAGATPALAAGTFTLGTTQVAAAGGTVLYLYGTGSTLASALGARFVTPVAATCPTLYGDAAVTAGSTVVNAGAVSSTSATRAYLTTPAMTAGSSYKLCLYGGVATGSTTYAGDTTADTVTAVNVGTLNAYNGKAADKLTLTAPTGTFSGTTYTSQFISGVTACPSAPATASATVIAGTTAKASAAALTITVPTLVTGTSYLICNYAASALFSRADRSFAVFDTTLPALTVSPNNGSSGTATNVLVSVPAASAVFTGAAPAVLVSRSACPATYAAGATGMEPFAATTTKISTTKLAVVIPTTTIVGGMDTTTGWNVCAYASTSGALLAAPGTFNAAPALSVASVTFAVGSGSALSTGSGPAQGGSSVTFAGLTGIPTTAGSILSASLGGSPITITKVNDATSFTGTTSSHAAGAVNLSITTAAGTKSTSNTPYSYSYGITVTPNTGASNTTPVLDILGAGFSSLSFLDVVTATALVVNKSYVLLTDNTWNAQDFTTAPIGAQAVKAVSYCNTVLPISDSEIICTLDLTKSISGVASNAPTIASVAVPNGNYTVSVVNSGTALQSTAFNYSIVSSGSAFTVSPY